MAAAARGHLEVIQSLIVTAGIEVNSFVLSRGPFFDYSLPNLHLLSRNTIVTVVLAAPATVVLHPITHRHCGH